MYIYVCIYIYIYSASSTFGWSLFFPCASFFLQERVAREMATNPKQEAFYKEMPTYQADLNEALLGFFYILFL